MLKLKPSRDYPEYWSRDKKILKCKNSYWLIREYYGTIHYLEFSYWKNQILKKSIKIPLNWHTFYIQFVYQHLGKCHKDLRSKFYIGKPRN